MNFFCKIIKCKQAFLLFFVICVVQAAPIAEQDGKFLGDQLDNLALVGGEQIVPLEGIATIPQQQMQPSQNNIDTKNEHHVQPGIERDKPKIVSIDSNQEYGQPSKDDLFFNATVNEINGSGRVNTNPLPNKFRFDNEVASPTLFRQNGIIQNNEQLKVLAHNVFSDETLEDVLLAQQEVKMLVNQADAWVKDVLFDDSNWRLEDSIYGSAAILFINDSSLIRFLKKLDGDSGEINQIRKQLERQDVPDKEAVSETESGLMGGYFSVMEFWNEYAGILIIWVVSIAIILEAFNFFSKALKPKEKRKSRRDSRRSSRRVRKKESSPSISLPAHGRVASSRSANFDVTRGEKYKHSSRRHHHNRRHRVKRSWVRKVLDDAFADGNKNR